MHGLGFNRFAAKYLSRVKVDGAGVLPQPHTPFVINKFAADLYTYMGRKPGHIWLIIGGTAAAHKVELYGNPDMNMSGTITHDGGGMLPDGTTGAANTGEASTADLFPDIHNWSFGFYSRTNTSDDTHADMGGVAGSGKMGICARRVAGNMSGYLGTSTGLQSSVTTNSLGLHWANRYKSSTGVNGSDFWRNTTAVYSLGNVASSGLPSAFSLCHASGWQFSNRKQAFIFCCPKNQPSGSGMYNLVQPLQVHLGRAV